MWDLKNHGIRGESVGAGSWRVSEKLSEEEEVGTGDGLRLKARGQGTQLFDMT